MLVTKKVTREVTETVVDDVICNWCGESCKCSIGNVEGLPEISLRGGYGSKFIGDMNEVSFAICERCLVERLFPQFKHPPVTVDHLDPIDPG